VTRGKPECPQFLYPTLAIVQTDDSGGFITYERAEAWMQFEITISAVNCQTATEVIGGYTFIAVPTLFPEGNEFFLNCP
jgi:hypothetical protein